MQLVERTPEDEGFLFDDIVDLMVIEWMVEAVSFDGLLTE